MPSAFATSPWAHVGDCVGARDIRAREAGAIEVACLGHCDLAPAMTRGDEIVPAVTHSTNEGPAVALGGGDTTLAEYEARGGLSLLRDLPQDRGAMRSKTRALSSSRAGR